MLDVIIYGIWPLTRVSIRECNRTNNRVRFKCATIFFFVQFPRMIECTAITICDRTLPFKIFWHWNAMLLLARIWTKNYLFFMEFDVLIFCLHHCSISATRDHTISREWKMKERDNVYIRLCFICPLCTLNCNLTMEWHSFFEHLCPDNCVLFGIRKKWENKNCAAKNENWFRASHLREIFLALAFYSQPHEIYIFSIEAFSIDCSCLLA